MALASLFESSLLEHSLLFASCYGSAALLVLHTSSPLRCLRYGKLAPTWAVLQHECLYCACSIVIASFYDAIIHWDVETGAGWTNVHRRLDRFSYSFSIMGVVGAALLAEAHFFWTHRLMHWSTWLYVNVHKVHHVSHDPNPLSGISFHPIEGGVYFSSVLLGAFLLPMNLSFFRAWRTALFLAPIGGHLGLGTARVWPLHMVSHYHHIHHTKVHCNYGGFILWDWLCGTTYDDWRRREVDTKRAVST